MNTKVYRNGLVTMAVTAAIFVNHPVQGQNNQGYFSVLSENDIYAPSAQDRHYSNGIRFGLGLTGNQQQPWYSFFDGLLDHNIDKQNKQREIAIGQNLYTPENFLNPDPIINDRPFAGWLYGELTSVSNLPGTEKSLTINVGLVGPIALGEEIQKFNHSIINDPRPKGWGNQLNNEPALLIKYRQSWFNTLSKGGEISSGLITRMGLNMGNVFTDAGVGMVFRIGNYLSEKELPLRIQPGLSGNLTNIEVRKDQTDWQMFAEIQGRGIARNIFLDGNSFTNSLSVSKKHFVYDLGVGITMGLGHFRYPVTFSFNIVWRSREFDLQQGKDNFGSALITIGY